jgi:hypothetical protein
MYGVIGVIGERMYLEIGYVCDVFVVVFCVHVQSELS